MNFDFKLWLVLLGLSFGGFVIGLIYARLLHGKPRIEQHICQRTVGPLVCYLLIQNGHDVVSLPLEEPLMASDMLELRSVFRNARIDTSTVHLDTGVSEAECSKTWMTYGLYWSQP